jgi:hypothetical protein
MKNYWLDQIRQDEALDAMFTQWHNWKANSLKDFVGSITTTDVQALSEPEWAQLDRVLRERLREDELKIWNGSH